MVMYTSSTSKDVAAQVLRSIKRWLPEDRDTGTVQIMMVVGTPNVGKTTFINAMKRHAVESGLSRAQKASKLEVGPTPGVTKRVSGVKV
jgi:ribosome biogenesis GTPase A